MSVRRPRLAPQWRSIEYFKSLGLLVEGRWRAKSFRESDFPRVAYEALVEFPAPGAASAAEPLSWVLSDAEISRPLGPNQEFGQPPITVFQSARFCIDVLYWRDGTTAIHSHPFSGAFQVLTGSSVHGVWRFDAEDEISERMQLGRTTLTQMELLAVGDTRPIAAGNAFIHSLFHLDHPSVTVVVRSNGEARATPPYQIHPPNLAMAAGLPDPRLQLRVQALAALHDLDRLRFASAWRQALSHLDFQSVFEILRQFGGSDGIIDEESLGWARRQHGARVEALRPTFAEMKRQSYILARRRQLRTPEHRFFLALLLNAPNRGEVLRMVAARHPEVPPLTTVLRWLRELAATPVTGEGGVSNALGLTLDEEQLDVLGYVLEDIPFAQLLERLGDEYRPRDVAAAEPQLLRLNEAVRAAPLLQLLFRA
jgi:hypothetical protein